MARRQISARAAASDDGTAWAVAAGSITHPVYWAGAGWSANPAHAVLLVRQQDARRVADNMALMGPEWGIPDDVRAVPAHKLTAPAMVRALSTWRLAA